MDRSRKILLAVIYAVNCAIGIVLLLLFARGHSFHLAGVYFTPGIPILVGMVAVDGLIFFLLSAKSK